MQKSVLLSQYLLPTSSVSLGRFITNIDEPHQDYHDPNYSGELETAVKLQIQYDSTHQSVTDSSSNSQLTAFLSSAFSKRLRASVRVTSEEAKIYYLQNSAQAFRDATQREETRRWIERTIDEGEDIYVIVGYSSLSNARFFEHTGSDNLIQGQIKAPVSAALMASGVIVPFSDIVDPGIGASQGRSEDTRNQFVAPGEQIFAVQYRKVRYRWFAKDKLETMKLEKKVFWEKYDRARYLDGDTETGIEVELNDELELKGDYEEYTDDLGEIFLAKEDSN